MEAIQESIDAVEMVCMQPPGTSLSSIIQVLVVTPLVQFALSGETESFGSNNLMGQWLSAIGGYSVEQVDYYPGGVAAFGIWSTLICAT